MNWQTTYPCLAAVMEANFETLNTWVENLPAPQTDVERTVMRRLKARHKNLLREQINKHAPGFSEKFNDVVDRLSRLTGKSFERM